MNLLLIILIVLLVFGGGGVYLGGPNAGLSTVAVLIVIVFILWLAGALR